MKIFNIMNIVFPSLIYLLIFLGYFEEIIASKSVFFDETEKTPLVLTRDPNRCKPVVPQKPKDRAREGQVQFTYHPALAGEYLVLVCPPGTFTVATKKIRFLNSDFKKKIKDKNVLYEVSDDDDVDKKCPSEFIPSVAKKESESSTCFHGAQIIESFKYSAGFWIWNEKTEDIEHVSIYDICYSTSGSVLYTVHNLVSLEFLSTDRYFKIDRYKFYKSDLGPQNQDGNKDSKHQFVPALDQPLYTWQVATMLPINVIYVTKTVQQYLQNVDYYIRGSFILMGVKPVKMYSGKYTATWEELSETFHSKDEAATQRKFPSKQYTFFWRVATYHSCSRNIDFAIAFITQIAPFDECIQICENISVPYKWTLLQNPTANQCTYTCVVDDYIKGIFGLAFLEKPFAILRETPEPKKTSGRRGNYPAGADDASASATQQNDAGTSSDGGASLAVGLMAFDVALEIDMLSDNAGQNANEGHDGHDGDGAEGGGGE